MGLLTILSRRPRRFQSREDLQRSQQVTPPLETTRSVVASSHSSTYRTRSIASPSEDQASDVSPNQTNALNVVKPLLNPALRSLDDYRPTSAESFGSAYSDRPRTLQRPKREARKPPVSFRKPSSLSSTQTFLAEPYPSQIVQVEGTDSEAVSWTKGHERTGSMTSLARRQSKDLLDAVEEFRPLDFRSRVQAAGARDYGEDVADRNLLLYKTKSTPNLYSQFSSGQSLSSPSENANGLPKPNTSLTNQHYETSTRALPSKSDFSRPESFSRKNKNRLSLNTYQPSGFVLSPTVLATATATPRSNVTTPGHRGGMTPSDFEFSGPELDMWSRQYHLSPAMSNFSVPISPKTTRHPAEVYQPQHLCYDDHKHGSSEDRKFSDSVSSSNHSSQRKSAASDVQGSAKAAARFSQATVRSSLASSVTSRYPSIDFMPLGYPRLQRHPKKDLDTRNPSEDLPTMWRSQSLRSHRHSRSNSSGHTHHSQQRTKSLLTTPAAPINLVVADGATTQPRSTSTHDWAVVTPSNGSASSSFNGLYSGASGSVRPVSRHTQTTSVDSIPRPRSSQSCLSASIGQSTSGWSPATTRSTTGFNIDDYISSDDDSFTPKKRPTGEGEEDLLFKDGYGATGMALPGLLESMMGAGPRRGLGHRGKSQLTNPSELSQADQDGEPEGDDDDDAAEGPDIDDIRLRERRDSPFSIKPRYAQDDSESEEFQTSQRPSSRTQQQPNNSSKTSSWMPSDDKLYHGTRGPPVQTKRPTTSSSSISYTGMSNDETRPPHRGQTRLSALGPMHGRNPSLSTAASLGEDMMTRARRRTNSRGDNDAAAAYAVSGAILVNQGEVDPVMALRLRKEAKARKREDEAKMIREKRMTRAFGRPDESHLAALQAQVEREMEERGRTRVRGTKVKGKSVVSG